jgi:hypothetical protein
MNLLTFWKRKETPSPEEARLRRVQLRNAHSTDTADERKRAWLKTLRPRISKGRSGAWWCVSEHKSPQHVSALGTVFYKRVGVGSTPREAYDSWLEF